MVHNVTWGLASQGRMAVQGMQERPPIKVGEALKDKKKSVGCIEGDRFLRNERMTNSGTR